MGEYPHCAEELEEGISPLTDLLMKPGRDGDKIWGERQQESDKSGEGTLRWKKQNEKQQR